MAVMKLDNDIKHTSKEIFDQFAPLEQGFVKTLIPVREMCPLGNPVARSQARRILRRLEEFREIPTFWVYISDCAKPAPGRK